MSKRVSATWILPAAVLSGVSSAWTLRRAIVIGVQRHSKDRYSFAKLFLDRTLRAGWLFRVDRSIGRVARGGLCVFAFGIGCALFPESNRNFPEGGGSAGKDDFFPKENWPVGISAPIVTNSGTNTERWFCDRRWRYLALAGLKPASHTGDDNNTDRSERVSIARPRNAGSV